MASHRSHSSALLLVSVCIFTSCRLWSPTEGTAGTDFLDEKEKYLTMLLTKVEENYNQQCELLQNCSNSCSRSSCAPLKGDVKNFICLAVFKSTYCTNTNDNCQSKNFDYSKSYVRIAPTTDPTAVSTATTICSQRELDIVFKNVTSPYSLSRAFFGSVDGTYRHFPGTDQSVADCHKYDPRLRPWYRASTSVTKVVMVLIDVGAAMGTVLPAPLVGTHLLAAQTIVGELLNTLSESDYVNIITFGSSKATALASSPVRVQYYLTADSTYHPEFDALKSNMTQVNLDSALEASNITFGIQMALSGFANFSEQLKVIIALTDGSAATLREGALAGLDSSQVKLLIFKLPQSDDSDIYLTNSAFLSQLCNIGGSFNVISTGKENPLLSMQAYFSFLAVVHASLTNHSSDYSIIYQDYEQVANDTFSISKAAFGGDGKLLGVVGLNIFMDDLQNMTDQVTAALQSRTAEKAFDPAKFLLTKANCSIQQANGTSALQPCGSSPIPLNAGLCTSTDTTSTIQDLACCDICATSLSTKSKIKRKVVLCTTTISTITLGIIILVVSFICKRHRNKYKTTDNDFIYPGDNPPGPR